MTRSYKGHKIQTVIRVESGRWQAWAKITPSVSGIHTITVVDCPSQQKADAEVWEQAKKVIDDKPD